MKERSGYVVIYTGPSGKNRFHYCGDIYPTLRAAKAQSDIGKTGDGMGGVIEFHPKRVAIGKLTWTEKPDAKAE